jgi:DNA-binding transcriptional ArsR family regulator
MKQFDCLEALKALGEETRIRMLRVLLENGQSSVGDVADALGLTQYNCSKHLRILREAGLVEMEPSGQQRRYAIAADFRTHLSTNKNILDLGCCSFNFSKLP